MTSQARRWNSDSVQLRGFATLRKGLLDRLALSCGATMQDEVESRASIRLVGPSVEQSLLHLPTSLSLRCLFRRASPILTNEVIPARCCLHLSAFELFLFRPAGSFGPDVRQSWRSWCVCLECRRWQQSLKQSWERHQEGEEQTCGSASTSVAPANHHNHPFWHPPHLPFRPF